MIPLQIDPHDLLQGCFCIGKKAARGEMVLKKSAECYIIYYVYVSKRRRGDVNMFGYVKAYVPELRMREYEFYRAVYCGLCGSMKKLTGLPSTFTLSYDMVFLSLCRMAVLGHRYEVKPKRCGINPFRVKKRAMMTDGDELRYAAAVSALLTECKIMDDVTDESGFRRMRAKLMLGGAKRALRRACVPCELENFVRSKLSELYAHEGTKPDSVGGGAELFGELLGRIFAYGIDGDSGRILHEIGRGVGRYIYIIDAVDDVGEDIKSGRYNPIASLWAGEITDGELSLRAKDALLDSLKLELSRAAGAVMLIELPDGGYPETLELVKNIVYLGMPKEAECVLYGKDSIDNTK